MPTAPFLSPNRDDPFKTGRAKAGGGTIYYSIPGAVLVSTATATAGINTDCYSAWLTRTPVVIDQLAAEVTTTGGTNFRIGFYRANADWQPIGAPMADSGNLDSTGLGVKTYTPGTPIYVQPGRYLSIISADNSNTAFRIFRSSLGTPVREIMGATPYVILMSVSRAYAAFPTPGTAWDTVNSNTTPSLHYVVYRVSGP